MDSRFRASVRAFVESPSQASAAVALSQGERVGVGVIAVLRWALNDLRWRQMDEELQMLVGRNVETLTHHRFSYEGLREFELGPASSRIACYSKRERFYSLVPGGNAILGVDTTELSSLLAPTSGTVRWSESIFSDRSGGPELICSVVEGILQDLLPLRRGIVSPMLVDQCSTAWAGWEALGVGMDYVGDDRVALEAFRQDGMRLPTGDEWEYLCRGGSQHLFRWGSTPPFEQPPGIGQPWSLHRRPNAFGLALPGDTYSTELCLPRSLRGGDGGDLNQSGCYQFAWLTLASPFDSTRRLIDEAGLGVEDCKPGIRLLVTLDDLAGSQQG